MLPAVVCGRRPQSCGGSCDSRLSLLPLLAFISTVFVVVSIVSSSEISESTEVGDGSDGMLNNVLASDRRLKTSNDAMADDQTMENLESDEEEQEDALVGFNKRRLSRFRSDFGKRRYRADFGKRGVDALEEQKREEREFDRYGVDALRLEDLELAAEKRARFRADLGKRAPGRSGRRAFRADLGKRYFRTNFE